MSEFPYQKERVKSRHVLLGAVAFGIAALFVYLGFSSRTSTWPETNCNVMGKRVVRADAPIGPYRSIVVLYRGEYHLRYTVDSRDYFLWVSSGWVDKDPNLSKTRCRLTNKRDAAIKSATTPPIQPKLLQAAEFQTETPLKIDPSLASPTRR